MPSESSGNEGPAEDQTYGNENAYGNEEEEEKPRLTLKQRKANHIASEQKRRQAIRLAYEQLTEIVPGIHGMSRSEGIVLRATLDHIMKELERRKTLIEELEAMGEKVDEADKQVLVQLEKMRERRQEQSLSQEPQEQQRQ